MKNTALTAKHEALGAKMVPFAGYNMPLQYSGVTDEHLTVRQGVGVFDVSHMGEFLVEGEHALDLIQKVTSNDAAKLVDGKVQYSCLPNGEGGIVDDLLVYRINAQRYLLVVNASNIDKDWAWITSHNDAGATLTNISDDISLLAVQGPKAADVLASLTDIDLANMTYYTFAQGTFAGVPDILVSATGYTGSGGFEVYIPNAHAETVWDAIFAAGAEADIKPIGLGARDTLRLEMGFCLYGNDIDDTTSPLEAGLGWITKFTKSFIDGERLQAQKEAGLARRLVGLEMLDRGPVPRQGHTIASVDGDPIGVVTSGTMAPSLKQAIAMGYVAVPNHKEGTEVVVQIRNKALKA
ncbi:MAG: glycine cleavage system aminomethyltransferase GcvT, partial [Bacteroidota bacterium]